MRIWGSVVALVLGWAAVAQAEPLNLAQIPDDAKWFAHVDVDAMRDSTVVRQFYGTCLAKHDADKHFDRFAEHFGFDPRTDLHGITLYGSKISKDEGVMIVSAAVDKQRLLQMAEKAPCHEVADYKDFKIHTWMHKKGKYEHKVSGAFFQDDRMVFGSTVEKVQKALDVLKGEGANLAGKKDSPLAQEDPAGAIFVARAVDLAEAEVPCKSPLLKQSKLLSLVKGEHEGQWFGKGTLVTDSPEVAEQVKQIIEGIGAMVLLQHGDDPEIRDLIHQYKLSVQNSTVTLKFQASAEVVVKQVEKICDKLAKMKEEHRKGLKEHKDRLLEKREL